jgi:hypothetical protein
MNKLALIAVFTSIVKVSFSQMPINLTSNNFPGNNDTLRYSNAQLSSIGNYTQTGTNFVWNYSTLVPASQGVRSYKSSLLTPYSFFFLSFNEYGEKIADTLGLGPILITNYYNFYKKQTSPVNAYVVDGAGMTLTNVPIPSYYSDKDELYHFPLTYPKYDSTTFKFSTPSSSLIPIVYSKSGYRVTKVDGWGTVTTPYGTASCLRVVTTAYSKDTIKNSIIPLPIGFQNYQRSYQWLTANSKIPFLEVSGNLIGSIFTPTQVRYRDNYVVFTGLNQQEQDKDAILLYPNPVTNKLFLNSTLKNASVEVFDATGKLIKQEVLNDFNYIDVNFLSTGLFGIKITNSKQTSYLKFIKE